MSWVTVIFSMAASSCLTMALIYAFIWWRQRDSWAYLLFALSALGTAGFAVGDMSIMQAHTPAQFLSWIRWTHVPVWLMSVGLVGFVRLYLRAGRIWLLWAVCGLRTISLVLNFSTGQNLSYRAIAGLRHVQFLGETISAPVGPIPNPWIIVGQLSAYALAIFVADAAVTAWRRGDRRLAVSVGGSVVFFLVAAAVQTALEVFRIVQPPVTPSLFYAAIIAAMCYELGGEMLRAAQTARDLRSSEQQIALAAEAANLGFWSREFTRDDFWGSEQWRALFGVSKTDRLNFDNFLLRLHPDDREPTRQSLARAYQGDGRYQAEYRVLRPDGAIRWVDSLGRVEFNREGKPVRVKGVSLDVTHRKLAELEAQTHRNELAHLLRVASLGELSSALTHELSQPLTAILGNAEAARLFIARDEFDVREIDQILLEIVEDDMRAGEVISRLRALLKKGEFRPQPLQPNELITDVLKLLGHELQARAVRVVTELGAGLPSIRGDRVQLQQVLINLILNAGDAMAQPPANARTLTLGSSRLDGDVVAISVADTGSGIPPGAEEKIFEPYHTTKPQGLGLGLSLSRSIVSAHGGRLWAENRPTGGALFRCIIPQWCEESQTA